jgi:hypothetical protein
MNDELRAKLWDYVYGLLDEAEAESLRAQISSDRNVAREYARVKLKSELVARAARASCQAGELPNLAGDAAKVSLAHGLRSRRNAQVGRWITTGATSLLAIGLLLIVGNAYLRPDSPLLVSTGEQARLRLLETYPRMLVTGPTTLTREHPTKYEVRLQQLDETSLPMPISASLTDRSGHVVWQATSATDDQGVCAIKIPAQDFSEDALQLALVVDASNSSAEEAKLTTWLAVADPTTPHYVAVDEAYDDENGLVLFRTVDLTPALETNRPALAGGYGGTSESPADAVSQQLAQDLARVRWGVRPLDGTDHEEADQEAAVPLALGVPMQPRFDTLSERLGEQEDLTAGSPLPFPAALADLNEMESEQHQPAPTEKQPTWLVEVTRSQNDLEAHFVRPSAVDFAGASDRELPKDMKIVAPAATEGRARWFFDYSSAPPQPVYQPEARMQPRIQPLHIEVRFDRAEYAAEDFVGAEIRVTDEQNVPCPAVLGVRVEVVPLEESETALDHRDSLAVAYWQAPSSADWAAALPLVFDNGEEQQRHWAEAWAAWQQEQNAERQRLAARLFWGSSLGLGLLLLAAWAHWLPRAAVGIPVAGTLGVLLLFSIVGMRTVPERDTDVVPVVPLTNYGLQSQPPPSDKTEPELFGIPLDRLAHDGADPAADYLGWSLPELRTNAVAGKSPAALVKERVVALHDSVEATLPQVDFWQQQAAHQQFAEAGQQIPAEASHLRLERRHWHRLQTVLWNPGVTTNESGVAFVGFSLTGESLCYRLVIDAHGRNYYGSTSRTIPSRCSLLD